MALTGCGFGGSPTVRSGPVDTATVVDVVDGDTVRLEIMGRTETVRLLGLDAPETIHPELPVQCFGAEATDRLIELLPLGSTVAIARDVEARDRYERLLLFVSPAGDVTTVNQRLVAEGYADVVIYEPNVAARVELTRARNRARADRVGLWGACDGPDQPVD